mmetsp:Transcript_59825/g.192573  ORF Transcript_59825/g.192573 Transcript_59825/m.192573 type:complete len:225 (-) Transcript_59825:1408-2082(-)
MPPVMLTLASCERPASSSTPATKSRFAAVNWPPTTGLGRLLAPPSCRAAAHGVLAPALLGEVGCPASRRRNCTAPSAPPEKSSGPSSGKSAHGQLKPNACTAPACAAGTPRLCLPATTSQSSRLPSAQPIASCLPSAENPSAVVLLAVGKMRAGTAADRSHSTKLSSAANATYRALGCALMSSTSGQTAAPVDAQLPIEAKTRNGEPRSTLQRSPSPFEPLEMK